MISSSDILHRKVLIVDNQEVSVLLLERLLRGAGYVSVTSTMDPGEVCALHGKNGYDLKLSYMGHVLMENRNGLLVQAFLTEATGRAEWDAAMLMAEAIPPGKRVTLGGDKNYDTQEFVRELRGMTSPRMWRRTRPSAEARSTNGPHGMRGMR
jgi:CheY-like chemotaxis protein